MYAYEMELVQVECVCGSLNQGDTFILDDHRDIYVWVGPKSEKKEKLAVSVANLKAMSMSFEKLSMSS